MNSAQDIADSISNDFNELPDSAKIDFLLEFANALPALPQRYVDHPNLLEKVEECQSPVYLFVEISDANKVSLFLSAPEEAPTTKAFASILHQILNGQSAQNVLQFNENFAAELGITKLVSPLRIRGLTGMLNRIKRQVREKSNGTVG